MTREVKVGLAPGYAVKIGSGLLADAGREIAAVVKPCRAALISDDRVFGLYGEQTMVSLKGAGFDPMAFAFKSGEGSKELGTLAQILEFLAEERLTRSDIVIALGGGVVGDMAGLAASLYLRGIRFVQIPTTLLAMVDSSVGGKTAVNLRAGKNLCGAFYQPSLVLADVDALKTLPAEVFAGGAAEVIKTAMILDASLLRLLAEGGLRAKPAEIIERCVAHKAKVVEEDERDEGWRQILNFGHTVGHGIEKLSGFEILHGQAVAMGMAAICRAQDALGWSEKQTVICLMQALEAHGLPADCPYAEEELFRAILSDKKRRGDEITAVTLKRIGQAELKTMPVEGFRALLRAGLGGRP
ncbi:MAG: 3-dehydroquinate synthase [Christensenellaceae bacterium]|jgi:3-dehydroquinate synthase|nr:3-dehydroquinate synthase [Christensenellaceae bacterium]